MNDKKGFEHGIKLNNSNIEKQTNIFYDPKTYFNDFIKNMNNCGYFFDVKTDDGVSENYLSVYFITKKNHKELGTIKVEYINSKKSLKIDYIEGKERDNKDNEWKPSGIASGLLAYALIIFNDIQQIEGRLRYDNIRVYKDGITRGLSEEDALKETPAYKLRSKFGYTVIDLENWKFPQEIDGEIKGRGELITKKSN